MKVWVYCGQHDLQVDVVVFHEDAKDKAKKYARKQKEFYKKRLVYTVDLVQVQGEAITSTPYIPLKQKVEATE